MKLLVVLILGCGVLAGGGCQHAVATKPMGHATFQFSEPTATEPKAALASIPMHQPTSVISPALPLGRLKAPVYPAPALAAGAGFSCVGVRLTIDATGRVASVDSSLRYFSTPGPWAEEFRRAVEAAVAEWRFRPASLVVIERVKDADGTDDVVMRSAKPTEWICDVSFTFTETGAVISGL